MHTESRVLYHPRLDGATTRRMTSCSTWVSAISGVTAGGKDVESWDFAVETDDIRCLELKRQKLAWWLRCQASALQHEEPKLEDWRSEVKVRFLEMGQLAPPHQL